MTPYFQQLYLRTNNSRFLISLCLPVIIAAIAMIIGVTTTDFKPENINSIIKVIGMFSYLSLLVIHGSEMGSGLYKRQITQGMNRIEVFKLAVINAVVYGIVFYIITHLVVSVIGLVWPHTFIYSAYLFSLKILLAFIMISFITLFISFWLKKTVNVILIGHFFVKLIDSTPGIVLSKFFGDEYTLVSPHMTFDMLSSNKLFIDSWMIYSSLLFYIILFLGMNYLRIKKMSFDA